MKVLSLTEPCATLIKEKKKLVETRSWKTSYRGELYIHASSTNKNYEEFKIDNFVIIPLYHPTAQISKEKQLEQYNKIWRKNGEFE